mgnify:CR=1 FL=1
MFDFDGDGDIDEFDEELAEYELQLMEDEMFANEMERGQYQESGYEEGSGRTCGLGVLITLGIVVLVFLLVALSGG